MYMYERLMGYLETQLDRPDIIRNQYYSSDLIGIPPTCHTWKQCRHFAKKSGFNNESCHAKKKNDLEVYTAAPSLLTPWLK